jgi:hypothetical protein
MGLIPWMLWLSQAFEQELETKYRITTSNPKITWDPESVIKSTIKENYPTQKNFFFDLYSHGKPTHLSFEKPITADLFIQLSKEYPDCKFFISTIWCYGWWLMDKIKDQTNLNNLYIFTQTKKYLPNTPIGWSTAYYNIILQALKDGKTYGQAIYEADELSNQLNYSDPETFLWWEYIANNKEKKTEQNNFV